MHGDIPQNGVESSHLEGIMGWDSHMMLATALRGQTNVTTSLVIDVVVKSR